MPRIIVVDDDPVACRVLARLLAPEHEVHSFQDGRSALDHFLRVGAELVITDLKMPGMDGLELLTRLKQVDPQVLVFLVTGFSSVETAVAAMKQGAYDYLPKPFEPDDVLIRIGRAFRERRLERRIDSYRQEQELATEQYRIISASPRMAAMLEVARKAARTDSTILVLGETGVGKELVARQVHQWSPRRDNPFVAVNCSALSEGIMESELFGHEKGAFTGATARRLGFFEMADRGTILLDEIGTTDSRFQVKLLRVLQDRLIYRVGGSAAIPVDARIIASTNQDLEEEAAAGSFRSDLYYRLSVVTIRVPPLRERMEDLPLLASHFIRKYRHINPRVREAGPECLSLLAAYDYPGNVRELENIIERAMILETGPVLGPEHLLLRQAPGAMPPPAAGPWPEPGLDIRGAEKEHILQVLYLCSGKKTEAARRLGINKTTLWRKMKRYGLE